MIPTRKLSSTSFSQKDTSKLCLDYSVAKQVAIDLVRGDSAIAELEQTNLLVEQLTFKTTQQDSIINVYKDKDANCLSQIDNYNKIRELDLHFTIALSEEHDAFKYKTPNKFREAAGFGYICAVTKSAVFDEVPKDLFISSKDVNELEETLLKSIANPKAVLLIFKL